MLQPGEWEMCLDRLYASVGDERALGQALGAFKPFLKAERAAFFTVPGEGQSRSVLIAAHNLALDGVIKYQTHYFRHDPWVLAGAKRGGIVAGAVYRGSDLVPRQVLKSSYFWKDYMQPIGLNDILSTVVESAGPGTPAVACTYQRITGQPPYDLPAARIMERLAPHLRRAWHLHCRLTPQVAMGITLQEVYQTIDVPMLFVARDGRVVENNPAGKALLAERAELLLIKGHSLHYCNGVNWLPLAPTLAAFADGSQTGFDLTASPREGGESLVIVVRRVHGAFTDRLAHHPAAAICTFRRAPADARDVLMARFKLTRAEVELARLLLHGCSVQQAANEIGVAVSTIRTHLAALFGKTGTRRQGELIALLLRQS